MTSEVKEASTLKYWEDNIPVSNSSRAGHANRLKSDTINFPLIIPLFMQKLTSFQLNLLALLSN